MRSTFRMAENKVGALPASGFSEAIAKILNHSGIPKPKRVKCEEHAHVKPELPLIDDTVESSSTTGNLHGTLKPLDIVVPHKGVKRTVGEIVALNGTAGFFQVGLSMSMRGQKMLVERKSYKNFILVNNA